MARSITQLVYMVALAVGVLIACDAGAATPLEGCAGEAICTAKYVPLGGIDQWIWIAGERKENPVLLVVHGGPGDVQWPQERRYKPWEEAFTGSRSTPSERDARPTRWNAVQRRATLAI